MVLSKLPTPPSEDERPYSARKTPKTSKSLSRSSKRTISSQEQCPVVMDGRHKRVWKACERCRMKKTKCDGESPCKRCKDDGLVCTAGSRKKTEFKQLPRGYAEVLENTQYALIATVQKLYTMVRNNESWTLGEPELNDRGQPVIHDIASKLGCIRPSPDLPYAFPEGEEDFAELQAQLQQAHVQQARLEIKSEDTGFSTQYGSSMSSPALDRTDRASSSESDHSNLSKDYQRIYQARQAATRNLQPVTTSIYSPQSVNHSKGEFDTKRPLNGLKRETSDEESCSSRTSFDTNASITSPSYTDFTVDSPLFSTDSPFSPWAGGDDFLSQPHSLDVTSHYIKQQQFSGIPRSSPLAGVPLDVDSLKATQFQGDGLVFGDGTIRPGMLDWRSQDYADAMDGMIYSGEY